MRYLVTFIAVCLLIAAMFGAISYSFLSTDWAWDASVFRGENARAGFAVWSVFLMILWLLFCLYDSQLAKARLNTKRANK